MLENLGRIIGNIKPIIEGALKKTGNPKETKINEVSLPLLSKKKETEAKPLSLPSAHEIKNRQNWRTDGKSLAEMWVKKFGDQKKIADVLVDLVSPDGDNRFNGNFKNMEIDQKQLDAALERLGNAPNKTHGRIRRILNKIFPFFNKEVKTKAIEKQLTLDLVGILTRIPIDVEYDNEGNTLTQTNGHVTTNEDGNFQIANGLTISADIQNVESDVYDAANLGTIRDAKGEVILARSGRTDNPGKIEQKSVFDIISRFEAAEGDSTPAGMVKNNDGIYEYRRVDVTFMDDSLLKATGTTLKSLWKMIKSKSILPRESEQKFYNAKLTKIDLMWSKKGGATLDKEKQEFFMERQIQVEGKDNPITVREYKPIVLNHVMSVLVEKDTKTGNINYTELAREKNISPQLAMLKIMTGPNGKMASIAVRPLRSGITLNTSLNNYIKKPNVNTMNELVKTLKEVKDSLGEEEQDLKTGLDCLSICLTGQDESGNEIDNARGSALQFITTSIISNLANLPIGIECKSGNDRTATGMAIICAQKEFKDTRGKFFVPKLGASLPAENDEESVIFANLFQKYIEKFAEPNVLASRGIKKGDKKPVLKCNKSPVFWEIVEPIIPESIFKSTSGRVNYINDTWNVKLE